LSDKLSEQEYRLLLGLQSSVLSADIPNLLLGMIKDSMGVSLVNQEVKVSGTVETQDLQLVVRLKVSEEMT